MFYSFISILCILTLAAGFAFVLKRLLNRNRRERVEFVRSFKSGQCAFIFLPTLVLVFMGLFYSSPGISVLFKAIPLSMNLVVFGFEMGELEALMNVNAVYEAALYLDCFLIIFNACMLFLSLFKEKVHYKNVNRRFLKTGKSIVIIFGLSEENKAIYSSSPERTERFIYAPLTKEEKYALYNESIDFLTLHEDEIFSRLSSFIINGGRMIRDNQRVDVFINTGDDTRNIILADRLLSYLKSMKENDPLYGKLSVYMFGSNEKNNLYIELEEKGKGCFHYVDEYKLAALELIEKHPMASFFDSRQLNDDTTIKRNIEIKVFMVGFGNSNRELFLQSVANDQFVTKEDLAGPCHKNVKYYLFDRKRILENSNLNFSYNRYKDFVAHIDRKGIRDHYLDIAPLPCEEHLVPMQDIESKSFLNKLYENLAFGEGDINLISVSLGCDIESIDLANKIMAKTQEWGLDNTHVCVRIRNIEDAENIADERLLLWGDRKSSVYNYSAITRKRLELMAMIHDGIYDRYSKERKNLKISENEMERMKTRIEWYRSKKRIERESSKYVCFNFRTKLCLMGLNGDSITPDLVKKKVTHLSAATSDNLARQEHYRWNAFYIISGFIPVSIKAIKDDSESHGKDMKRRKHPNLLEFDALKDYEEITNKKVILYDYQPVNEIADMVSILGRV